MWNSNRAHAIVVQRNLTTWRDSPILPRALRWQTSEACSESAHWEGASALDNRGCCWAVGLRLPIARATASRKSATVCGPKYASSSAMWLAIGAGTWRTGC